MLRCERSSVQGKRNNSKLAIMVSSSLGGSIQRTSAVLRITMGSLGGARRKAGRGEWCDRGAFSGSAPLSAQSSPRSAARAAAAKTYDGGGSLGREILHPIPAHSVATRPAVGEEVDGPRLRPLLERGAMDAQIYITFCQIIHMKGSSPFGLNPLLDQNRKWSYLVRTWSRASSIGRKSGRTGPAEHARGQFDHGGWNGALLLV